jgi:hypothetical protein
VQGNNNNVDQAVNEYFDNIGGPNKVRLAFFQQAVAKLILPV